MKTNYSAIEESIAKYLDNCLGSNDIIAIMEALNLSRYKVKKCLENSDKFVEYKPGHWRVKAEKTPYVPPMKYYSGTSVAEQFIFYYVRLFFPDVRNRLLVESNLEVDVVIPSIKVAIEYDGEHWHEKKIEKDIKKTKRLNELGYYVIRVRQAALPEMCDFYGQVIIHSKKKGIHTNDFINKLIHILGTITNDKILSERLLQFDLSFEQLKLDSPAVYSLLYTNKVSPSLADCIGAECFDVEKNAPLVLENCPPYLNEKISLHFVCHAGKELFVKDFLTTYEYDCWKNFDDCSSFCAKKTCPYIWQCWDFTCDYMMKAVKESLWSYTPKNKDDYCFNDDFFMHKMVVPTFEYNEDHSIRDKYMDFLYEIANKDTPYFSALRFAEIKRWSPSIDYCWLVYEGRKDRYRMVEKYLLFDTIRYRAKIGGPLQLKSCDEIDKTRRDFLFFFKNALERNIIVDVDDLFFCLKQINIVSAQFAENIVSILKAFPKHYKLAKEHEWLGQWIK